MRRKWLLFVVLCGALAAGRGMSEDNGPPPKEVRDMTQVFEERLMIVKGQGVAPTDRPLSSGQKEIMALRAAKVVALRELAEVLSGVRVTGETCVQDAAARSDEIKATVDGIIKGAEVVHESYDDRKEIATVYVQLNLDGPSGLTQSLLPKIMAQKAAAVPAAPPYVAPPAPPASAAAPADALIIDATGKNFRPALINRVVVNNGNVLFEPSKIPPEILAKKGCGDYTSDLGKAKAIVASHGAKNPLVVTASGVMRSTDAQVSETDAAAIFTANQKTNFLEGAQVVFVL
ncbi:MAG TPA: hypothetical protein VN812_14635 [Candidatus Acidoferrales bacterium]|nr:hypothetical protein [Candidatus Acidoferrales bacterium]